MLRVSLRDFYKRLSFHPWTIPLAFLTACILAFGLLIPGLGYYMDDWPYVFYADIKGVNSLKDMLLYDSRPYAAWLYMLGFQILGFKPLHWHISLLLLRWGTVVMLWLTMRAIWPARTRVITYVALLFAVYPFFMLQPSAVGSTHHWAGFLFYSTSLYLMAAAYRSGKGALLLTVAALALEAVHLFTSEYFSGLELLRPVILWIILTRKQGMHPKRVWGVFLRWLPYLTILLFFSYWRVAIFENPPGVFRNSPRILYQLAEQPLSAIGFLINASLKDAISVLTIGWQKASNAELLDFSSLFSRFRLLVSVLGFSIAYIFLSRLDPMLDRDAQEDDWPKGSLLLCIVALAVAGLPAWLVGRTILESKNLISASRVGIPAMFGASLLIGLLVDRLISNNTKKAAVLSFCLALALNFHLDNTRVFQYSWEKQIRFYQELLWRAPQIEQGTAIITDQEILPLMGLYATSYGIITSYQPGEINTPPYWYFPLYYTYPDIDAFIQGIPIEYEKFTMTFSGRSANSLVIAFEPELDRCLWLLRPEDTNLRLINEDLRRISVVSALDRIPLSEGNDPVLPEKIYGSRPDQGWCYYFEKADLARQYGQWDQVINLWEQAAAAKESAGNGFEYVPFIEGYAHREDWGMVRSLTKAAHKISQGLEPTLCETLDRLMIRTPVSQDRDQTITDLKEYLKCKNYQ